MTLTFKSQLCDAVSVPLLAIIYSWRWPSRIHARHRLVGLVGLVRVESLHLSAILCTARCSAPARQRRGLLQALFQQVCNSGTSALLPSYRFGTSSEKGPHPDATSPRRVLAPMIGSLESRKPYDGSALRLPPCPGGEIAQSQLERLLGRSVTPGSMQYSHFGHAQ